MKGLRSTPFFKRLNSTKLGLRSYDPNPMHGVKLRYNFKLNILVYQP